MTSSETSDEPSIESVSTTQEASSLDSLCPPHASERCPACHSPYEVSNSPNDPLICSVTKDQVADLCINTIRFLSVDAINHANSGHPGICMGMAATAYVLFDKHIRFNPANPTWLNRDRFVLSAGHGSMLLYSVLHLYGYKSVGMEDIKQFRKHGSRTPGHPESSETPGVEVSTGPLGQGISNAVGLAIAEAHIAGVYNRPGFSIVDNFTYCIAGDGCLMEGISSEASSLAGHLKLGKLIVMYDDNRISIDGSTDLAFTENVSQRYESYGWQVIHVKNGSTDIRAIDEAISAAKRCTDKPSLIKISTTIGYGSPNMQGSASVHGAAIGTDETAAARKALNYTCAPFEVSPAALEHFRRKIAVGKKLEGSWSSLLREYKSECRELHSCFERDVVQGHIPEMVETAVRRTSIELREKSQATRKHSKAILNTIAPLMSSLIGGAADTSPSTLTTLECSKTFNQKNRTGRNIHFGVREHAMGAICNGIVLAGYNLRGFCSTFFVFSDYMRSAMRMASLSKARSIFVMTHDSIGLGEDGPSHQPIEHLASFRAMPNHDVWRPADGVETGAAYMCALESRSRPSTLVLSRQTTASLNCTSYDGAKRGGYIARTGSREAGELDGTLISTGSELALCVSAAERMHREHRWKVRVVSLPCWEKFERQSKQYRRETVGVDRDRTVAVEAASSFGWGRYADHFVCVDEFGTSGKGVEVMEAAGITEEAIQMQFAGMMGNADS